MSDADIVALVAAHVEGDLDPVSRSHLVEKLNDDATLRTIIGDQVRTHLLLHALLHRPKNSAAVQRARLISATFSPKKKKQLVASAQALRPASIRLPSRWWYVVVASASAAAALIIGAWFSPSFTNYFVEPRMMAQVVAHADVRIVRGPTSLANQLRNDLLQPGDTVVTAADQRAALVYDDEKTVVDIGPLTRVQAIGGVGKRFRLELGTVDIKAMPQPPTKPMVVETPHADVTVIGTAFNLSSDPFLTWLNVSHGQVQLKNHAGESLSVGTGQRALAADRLQLIPNDRGCGLIGEYYQGMDLSNLKWKRLDSEIAFDWETDEPAPGMTHPFSVRWTGMIEARFAETYRIFLPSDDGVRLWIDNRLVYDNWRVQAYHDDDRRYGVFTFDQDRLRVPIRLEFFERHTFAILRLMWMSNSQPRQVIPASALYPEGY
jgi:ferric-dicitrate binding protein FerR (iron transport regulator)